MPKKVKEKSLDTRAARAKLKVSGKPYYRDLGPTLHLGYRKGKDARRWVARLYLGGERYRVVNLGHADDVSEADGAIVLDYWQAQEKARALLDEEITAAARYTVTRAVEDYIVYLEGRPTQEMIRARLAAYVPDSLLRLELGELDAETLEAWMRSMATMPARASTAEGAQQNFRSFELADDEHVRRRRASANRVATMLKAALNLAFRRGKVSTDAAWRRLQAFRNVDATRVRYLSVAEARRLVNSTDLEFRPMVQAALITGARFSELARLRAEDLNVDAGVLHVRKSKSGKARHITLTDEGVEFFATLAAGRLGHEQLVPQIKDKTGASRRVRLACERAKISPPAKFHELRHTWASLAVMGGMPLMVVARSLGHADTRMVERCYGHLAENYITATVRKHAPQFGIVSADIRPIR